MNDETARHGENSFRNILKGTSIFGGVQVLNILISTIRLKFVAVILGPAGMGVAGLFNTASLTLQQFASLGLNLSIVKETGAMRGNEAGMRNVLAAIRPLVIMSALLGALICLMFPALLSDLTFGSRAYTSGYLLLSAAVFFSIIGAALMSVLQGLHAVKPLSRASLVGAVTGLAAGVPLYWLLGTDGIVPAMIVLALATSLWYGLSLRKVLDTSAARWNREVHLPILRRMLLMGLVLMSNDLFRNLSNFLINVYVRSAGGIDEVGFFQSCNTMTSQYSAIVFTAMAMDYLPRLSAVAGDNRKMCEVVNRQIEIVGLLICPVVCAVVLLAPVVIEVLQSSRFLVAVPLFKFLALAVILRALMYPPGYIVFAKDNKRLFFWMEAVGANILTLCLTCGGYRLFGLNGLGYAAIVDCAICFCVYVAVNRRLYGYRFSRAAAGICIFAVTGAAAMAACSFLLSGIIQWAAGTILLIAVTVFALRGLLRRLRK